MRILLSLILLVSLAACGKKKAPQAPGGASEMSPMENGSGGETEKNVNTPDDADDASPMKSDPEEGGE